MKYWMTLQCSAAACSVGVWLAIHGSLINNDLFPLNRPFAVLQDQDSQATEQDPQESDLPNDSRAGQKNKLAYSTDFTGGMTDWDFTDAQAWKISKDHVRSYLSQHRKPSSYQPQVRSPLHQAILKSPSVGSFDLQVDVRSTHADYNHRDVCLFFGYQSPSEFYYVHLGKEGDDYCNQIFIVNNQDRRKISLTTTPGTPWSDKWHTAKVVRNVDTGSIEIFFDDMTKPVMTASDKTFTQGRVGLGSFDDTADWANFRLTELASE